MKAFIFCPYCKSPLQLNKSGYNECSNVDCSYMHYDNPTPVVAAIVEWGKEQLILAHNIDWPAKWFGLITGFLEKHEHPEDCVLRELKEELGLNGRIQRFIGHYTFEMMNQIILAYHVKADGEIVLGEELDDYRIIPFSKAKAWPQGTGMALKDFLESRGYYVDMIDPFSLES